MSDLNREMLEDAAKLWLAHDGLWFQEIEKAFGLAKAIELDKNAWERFTVIEAKRIMSRHNIPANGGLPALKDGSRISAVCLCQRSRYCRRIADKFPVSHERLPRSKRPTETGDDAVSVPGSRYR